ncbi:hypothetical protein [Nocardiopsis sp. Huas11]|uniref:hypothetical protein n=1 Tax=Nocardiopsis sp. Huas11 TaxID=2183912 RepID=UPI0013154D33|nr:hypothetical protein [Nocardiopsis sp. Huas11]
MTLNLVPEVAVALALMGEARATTGPPAVGDIADAGPCGSRDWPPQAPPCRSRPT